MPTGTRFTIKEKILLAKFSLLNIETILKGMANKEAIAEMNIAAASIVSALSCEVFKDKNRERGKTMTVKSAM